jgi:hypothetical protein
MRAAWLSPLALLVVCGFLAPAAPTQEACPWRWQIEPTLRGARGPPPRAIGDSVMVSSVRKLARAGFRSDARMCREWPEGGEIIQRLAREGRLPERTVIALGSNGVIAMSDIRKLLPLLDSEHTLAIVTPRDPGGGGGQDAANVRQAVLRHPKKLDLLDWVRYSRGREHWFMGDGVHLEEEYAYRYLSCIKQALARYQREGHPCSP